MVAHFHYVLFGTIVFAVYAGIYFWFPKFTGRYLDERLGKLHFWLTFIGFHMTFLVQHWLGAEGMPRRYADYLPSDGFTTLNTFSTIGSFVLGASLIPFIYNVYRSYRYGEVVTADDPWGYGNSLEWATVSARRRGTTSRPSRGSAPSARPSSTTTRTCSKRLEAEAHGTRTHRSTSAMREPTPRARPGRRRSAQWPSRPRRRSEPARPIDRTGTATPKPGPKRPRTPERVRSGRDVTVTATTSITSVLATIAGRDRRASPPRSSPRSSAHDVDVRDVEQVRHRRAPG